MKKFLTLITLAVVGLLAGCEESIDPFVRFSENGVVFDAQGGTKSIRVTTLPGGAEWKVSAANQADWFTFEANQEMIMVTAKVNYSTETRSAQLTVSSPNGEFESRTIDVSQEAGEEMLGLSAVESYEFDSRGGTKTFTVDGSYEWNIKCSAAWVKVEQNNHLMTISVGEHTGSNQRETTLTISAGNISHTITITQHTEAENRYLSLVGSWEICASEWFYTTNGSLNELTYNPSPEDYCLIFDISEGEYGKTLVMSNFLYPGTSLTINYDSQSGGFVIPFGWTVLSYDVFLYITGISGRQFFFASYEVSVLPEQEGRLIFDMPTISGCDHIGFGLWTYNDNGDKVAFGYSSRPTLYPMGNITLVKK